MFVLKFQYKAAFVLKSSHRTLHLHIPHMVCAFFYYQKHENKSKRFLRSGYIV